MRLVMISDTHGMHDKLSLPDGDVLIHAGDLCMSGSMPEAHTACEWLKRQQRKFAHVVFIAGNHDFAFERDNPLAYLRGAGRVHYLLNSDITIDGVKFWGSPMTPWFNNWTECEGCGREVELLPCPFCGLYICDDCLADHEEDCGDRSTDTP